MNINWNTLNFRLIIFLLDCQKWIMNELSTPNNARNEKKINLIITIFEKSFIVGLNSFIGIRKLHLAALWTNGKCVNGSKEWNTFLSKEFERMKDWEPNEIRKSVSTDAISHNLFLIS